MDTMEKIYQVKGTLCRNFTGQISYTVCLDKTYHELDVEFSFKPQHFSPEDITPELTKEIVDYCRDTYGMKEESPEETREAILNVTKTEIHTLATLNDEFIGCVHRQLETRHMHFTSTDATEGCLPVQEVSGVLKVTLLAFSVLLDSTEYTLTVYAK